MGMRRVVLSNSILYFLSYGQNLHLSTIFLLFCRDLSDIGCFIKVIEGCQQLDKETK